MAVKKDKSEENEVVKPKELTTTIFIERDILNPKEDSKFVSVNGKNYQIQVGKNVEVPIAVAEVINNSRAMKEEAFAYIREKESKDEDE